MVRDLAPLKLRADLVRNSAFQLSAHGELAIPKKRLASTFLFFDFLYQISAIVTRLRFPNQFFSDSLVAKDGGSSFLFQYRCAGTSRHLSFALLRGR